MKEKVTDNQRQQRSPLTLRRWCLETLVKGRNMRRNAINVVTGIFLAVVFGLAGCGGGSGGTATVPTPMGTTVNLSVFKSVFLGTSTGGIYTFSALVGSDLQGHTWSGSHSLVADGAGTFEGQNVTESRNILNIHSDTSVINNLISMYFQTADHSFYKIIADPAIEFLPTTQTSLPDNPKVGDSGTLGNFTSNVATPTAMAWALNPGTNGSSILVLSSSFKTGSTAGPTEIYSYHLDPSGIPTKVTIQLNNGTTTVTLSGDRN